MITYVKEPRLFEDFEKGITNAIVIPVNCVGVMEKGVALEAKKRWLKLANDWKLFCQTQKVTPGMVHRFSLCPQLFVPTKKHWKNSSEIENIEQACLNMQKLTENLVSIGVPALGCGLGGLQWNDVKALYEKYLTDSPIHFICYEP